MQGGKLVEKFILRFIGLEQAKHEIVLVWATATLPLHKGGKDGLDMQLFHFRLSGLVAEALIQECNPSLNNLLDWWPNDEVVFLGLSKIDQSKFIDHFSGFSCTRPGYKRCGREATQLSADTTELLARNYRWIHSEL
jgi:hypothetical protein